ncbi:PAS domain S-box protein [Phormidium sp. CLA17]|uniref:PAS domain-containing hybrid sensor histidine kinase/response regulator n=1 Tax=Leptolyngbya sp. Cla-17 TaxID=2803751 RepID=UPI00149224DB|nr:PAS domain S-box protein [Leptolyngbya sp. Cla-17]MBM0744328.1 PAS domain S-box protein [Leptolyngbya sp. Cla-17]
MKANTAIGFILSGCALRQLSQPTRRSTRYAKSLAAIVVGLGLLTLIQYGFGVNLGIDQLLFRELATAVATSTPGRMSVNTALNFLLLGSALLLLSKPRSFQPGIQAFTVVAFFIALLGLLGYIYNIQEFYGFGSYTKMAVHTAIAFIILSTGILCLHPDQGIMGIITSQNAGGVMARRLLLPVLVIPPILSGMILAGYRTKLYGGEVGLALSAIFSIFVFAVVIWLNARILGKIDIRRQRAEEQRQSEARFRSLTIATSQIVWTTSADGQVLEDSPSWRAFTGQTSEAYKEFGWLDAVHPDDRDQSAQKWTQAVATKSLYETEYRLRSAAGDYRYFWVRGVPVLANDGSIHEWIGTCTDITNRKDAELALRQSEERLQAILDNSPAVIYMKDTEGRFLTANRQFESLFRLSKTEIVGKRNCDLFDQELAEAFDANDQKVLAAGTAMQWEELAPHDDGLHTYLSLKFPLLDLEGIPYATCGFSTDITDRKRAEVALQDQTNLLQLILHSMSDGIVVANEQGQFLIFNPAAEQMFGGGVTDTEANEWSQHYGLFLPDQVTPFPTDELPLVRAIQGESTKDGELFVRHAQAPDGRWILADAKPLRDESGQLKGAVVVCRDVTDRRQAENALKQSEERYRSLITATSQIVWKANLEGSIASNPAWRAFTGQTEAEFADFGWLDALHPDDREQTIQVWAQAVQTKSLYETEYRIRASNGNYRYFVVRGVPVLNEDGSIREWVGTCTDIHDRKQAEMALTQAKEAAEAANRAKSEFLANMSHELRTPLNGVIGYAQILQRANTLNEEDRSRIEVIHQCGSHLLTLINDILDLSKIEAQKVALMPTDFHLPAFLQGVAEMCRIRAELKGIQFQYQSAAELPIGIRADEKRLRQVLINLLSNAIKFTDAGSVTFTISFADEGKIRFEVRDTGIGIRQDKLQAIFQPFEQVSDAQRQSEGTGLGLAISQELVELMGSTIQVQSEVGTGSIFWFDVNLIEAAEWVKTAQANVHGQIIGIKGCRPKILVVDDRWENRSVVSKLLSPIGFDIVEAVSGQEGWHKAVEVQPDLMITDLVMPDVDGFELIKRMRESETFKDLIIVVSSASVFEADQYRSIEAGGNDFLPKPVLAAELLQKLQKHLQLEWIYEEQQLAIDSDVNDTELIAPPPAELEMLYKLAMKGNFKGIMKQIALLEQTDQKYSPFAKKLHQLAKGFQDEEILAFIRSYQ